MRRWKTFFALSALTLALGGCGVKATPQYPGGEEGRAAPQAKAASTTNVSKAAPPAYEKQSDPAICVGAFCQCEMY